MQEIQPGKRPDDSIATQEPYNFVVEEEEETILKEAQGFVTGSLA